MLKRIHLVLGAELGMSFLLCLGSLLSFILIGRMLQMRELFLGQSLGIVDLFLLFVYLTPFFLLLVLPISCMLSVFLTFLRMGSDNELVALKAGGVSLYQLLPAPLVLCALVAAVNFAVAEDGLAWGMNRFRETALELARSKAEFLLQPGVFNTDFPGLTLYARQSDPLTREMYDVFIQDARSEQDVATIIAPRGSIVANKDAGRITLLLEGGSIYRQEKGGMVTLAFRGYAINLNMDQLGGDVNLKPDPDELSVDDLRKRMAALEAEGLAGSHDHRKLEIELLKRRALPTSCLVLGIFALPLAASFTGLRQYIGVVLTLGLFLVYYSLLSLGMSLAETGALPVPLAMHGPNALFGLLSAYGVWLAARERPPRIGEWLSRLRPAKAEA